MLENSPQKNPAIQYWEAPPVSKEAAPELEWRGPLGAAHVTGFVLFPRPGVRANFCLHGIATSTIAILRIGRQVDK